MSNALDLNLGSIIIWTQAMNVILDFTHIIFPVYFDLTM